MTAQRYRYTIKEKLNIYCVIEIKLKSSGLHPCPWVQTSGWQSPCHSAGAGHWQRCARGEALVNFVVVATFHCWLHIGKICGHGVCTATRYIGGCTVGKLVVMGWDQIPDTTWRQKTFEHLIIYLIFSILSQVHVHVWVVFARQGVEVQFSKQ